MKTQLGHYEIVEELGRGGMGVVYKGYEPALGRFVAIKELSPSLAHDPNLVERFLREARSMAALNDPHIIQVYFIGTDEASGQPFFAMEFVEGDSLSGLLKREGKLSVENSLKILHQAAQGLATAHDKGVVHRDIKPGNLMLTPRGNVKIADFGIALATQDFAKKLTSTGEFVGTPGYLSPEVCMGKTVDQRSDIFSLGIVLFEMLTGRVPFTEESPLGLMLEVVKAEFPDIRQLNGEVDDLAADILARMVAKEPADRFQNCHQLAEALQAHPLVARGGTVKLPIAKPPADGATVVGMPTPASQKQRVATPPPVVPRSPTGAAAQPAAASPPTGASAAVPPPAQPSAAARPSALERSRAEGSGSGLKIALAIAAVLLLLVGGVGFAMRATLTDFARGVKDGLVGSDSSAYSDGVAVGKASNPVGVSQAAALPPADAQSSAAPAGDTSAAAPAVELGTNGSSGASEPAVAASTQSPIESAPASASASSPLAVTGEPSAPAPAPSAAAPVGSDRPIAAAIAQKVAERREVAAATQPKPVAAPPRVAVVALGDSAITGPARQRIEERLMDAGIDIVDIEMVRGVSGRSDLPGVLDALRREASVVVVVRAEGVGSEVITFYGQASTLYTANLTVRAYSVTDKRPLGAGFREKVNFTTLNADTQAEEAVRPFLSGLVSELSPYRRRAKG